MASVDSRMACGHKFQQSFAQDLAGEPRDDGDELNLRYNENNKLQRMGFDRWTADASLPATSISLLPLRL